jgi:hypothetical protein
LREGHAWSRALREDHGKTAMGLRAMVKRENGGSRNRRSVVYAMTSIAVAAARKRAVSSRCS